MAMAKPSILFINRVYAPEKGATGRMLHDLALGFVSDGWSVGVLTTGPKEIEGEFEGVQLRKLKASPKQSLFNYITIWLRLFKAVWGAKKVDIIVTMTDPPMISIIGRLIAKKNKIAHIHWCQDIYPDLLPVLDVKCPAYLLRRLKSLSEWSLKTCARIIVIGECMARRIGTPDIDPRRVTFIPNWPDRELHAAQENQFHPSPLMKESLKLDKPLVVNHEPKFRVLYAGNIGRAHPIDTILEAAALLQLSNPEIEFLFVGEGEGFDRLAEARQRRNLENIRLLPTQPKFRLREMMQGGDLHLISMKKEAAGLLVSSKIYSALAAERPTVFIGPEDCEIANILGKYGAGSVIGQDEAGALAQEILDYRMDGSKWFNAHKGARKGFEAFNADNAIQSWIACARTLIRYPAS